MSFLTNLFGAGDEQARSDELDRQRATLNLKQREKRGEEWYQETLANDAKAQLNVDNEINTAFDEGLQEGVDNVRGGLGSILSLPFRLIPPIGWVIIIVSLFFYFGGGVLVRRKITS